MKNFLLLFGLCFCLSLITKAQTQQKPAAPAELKIGKDVHKEFAKFIKPFDPKKYTNSKWTAIGFQEEYGFELENEQKNTILLSPGGSINEFIAGKPPRRRPPPHIIVPKPTWAYRMVGKTAEGKTVFVDEKAQTFTPNFTTGKFDPIKVDIKKVKW